MSSTEQKKMWKDGEQGEVELRKEEMIKLVET